MQVLVSCRHLYVHVHVCRHLEMLCMLLYVCVCFLVYVPRHMYIYIPVCKPVCMCVGSMCVYYAYTHVSFSCVHACGRVGYMCVCTNLSLFCTVVGMVCSHLRGDAWPEAVVGTSRWNKPPHPHGPTSSFVVVFAPSPQEFAAGQTGNSKCHLAEGPGRIRYKSHKPAPRHVSLT